MNVQLATWHVEVLPMQGHLQTAVPRAIFALRKTNFGRLAGKQMTVWLILSIRTILLNIRRLGLVESEAGRRVQTVLEIPSVLAKIKKLMSASQKLVGNAQLLLLSAQLSAGILVWRP